MLKKKNYKDSDHFSSTYSISVFAPNKKKYMVYYKRYKNQQSNNLSVYELVNNMKTSKNQSATPYSEDRTLQLISFDGDLLFFKKYLRKIGKIRIYDTGEGKYDDSTVFYALCVFKFQFDLVKCFRDDYLQTIVQEQTKNVHLNEDDRENERYELIKKHMGKQAEEKVKKLQQLQDDGFQVVTDIYGQYRMDYQSNKKFVENLPQEKKKKKVMQKKKRQEKLKEAQRLMMKGQQE